MKFERPPQPNSHIEWPDLEKERHMLEKRKKETIQLFNRPVDIYIPAAEGEDETHLQVVEVSFLKSLQTPPETIEEKASDEYVRFSEYMEAVGDDIESLESLKDLGTLNHLEKLGPEVKYVLIQPKEFFNADTEERNGFRELRTAESFVIGRKELALTLPDTVSGSHFKIGMEGGELALEDLDSTNGTRVEFFKLVEKNEE